MTPSRLLPLLCACIAAWLAIAPLSVRADELQDITQLFRQGNHAQALDRVNTYLASKPRDAHARFLKGLILTEQGKSQDAMQVFRSLTEDVPELPEPYNNLAVLYAAQGEYDKAKSALETAIRLNPNYATAHENLGDVYAKLAGRSYERALQIEKSNAGAQTKLQLIRELFSRTAAPAAAPAARTGK